jgi:hypothetical protein
MADPVAFDLPSTRGISFPTIENSFVIVGYLTFFRASSIARFTNTAIMVDR